MGKILFLISLLFLLLFPACDSGSLTIPGDVGVDTLPPVPVEIVITAPLNASVTNQNPLTIKGTITGRSSGKVLCNGQEFAYSTGQFECPVVLIEGENQITVLEKDSGTQASLILMFHGIFPTLTFHAPGPGSMIVFPNGSLAVDFFATDSLGLKSVGLNEQALPLNESGNYLLSYPLSEGLNILTAFATDWANNTTEKTVSTLYGKFASSTSLLGNAAKIFLGKNAIQALVAQGLKLFESTNLTALFLPYNPIYTYAGTDINIKSFTVAPGTSLQITPGRDQIQIAATFNTLEVLISFVGHESIDVLIKIDRLGLNCQMTALYSDPTLQVELDSLTVDLGQSEIVVISTGESYEIPALDTTLESLISELIKDYINENLPYYIESMMTSLMIPRQFEIYGVPFSIIFYINTLQVTEAGMAIELSGRFYTTAANPTPETPGFLKTDNPFSDIPASENMTLTLNVNLFNLIFHEVWQSGLLDFTLDQAFFDQNKIEIELKAGFMGDLLTYLPDPVDPESPLVIAINPLLPPVVHFENDYLKIGIGDLFLDFSSPAERRLFSSTLTSLFSASVTSLSDTLTLQIGDLEIFLDILTETLNGYSQKAVEPFFEYLIDTISGLINSMINEIPIPSFQGFKISDIRLDSIGPGSSYLKMEGVLEIE